MKAKKAIHEGNIIISTTKIQMLLVENSWALWENITKWKQEKQKVDERKKGWERWKQRWEPCEKTGGSFPLSRLPKFTVQKQRQWLFFTKLSPRTLSPIWWYFLKVVWRKRKLYSLKSLSSSSASGDFCSIFFCSSYFITIIGFITW